MHLPTPARRLGRALAALALILLICPTGASAQSETPPAPKPPLNILGFRLPGGLVVDPDGRVHEPNDGRIAPEDGFDQAGPLSAQASGDYRIDALLQGSKWNLSTVTFSFYEDSVFNGAYYGDEVGVREVSEAVKTNVRAILAWYGSILNLNFVEVTETPTEIGLIRIMCSESPAYAYAYYPTSTSMFSRAGDVHLKTAYDRLGDTNGFQHPPGKHGYVTLIHELGHTLGLKHPFEGTTVLPAAEDNESHTVMTYTFPSPYSPATPMGYDLLAVHYLYGARSFRSGDDTYTYAARPADQYALGGQTFWTTAYPFVQTIWDSGGTNTLDFSALPTAASGYRFDLAELGWLSTTGNYVTTYLRVGTALGPGVGVHRIIATSSSDVIYANPQANTFAGYRRDRANGSDEIWNATGADTLDLTAFEEGEVSQSRSGDDLVLTLGANGSVTLHGYYTGNQLAVLFAAPLIVRVGAVDLVKQVSARGASVAGSVLITDGSGTPRPGATVSAQWSGVVTGSAQVTTGADGRASFSSPATRRRGTITLTVTAVDPGAAGYTYKAGQNLETSDSIAVP